MTPTGTAIRTVCEALEAETLARATTARKAYMDLLSANAPQHVATATAVRQYEDDPSYANHLAYQSEWAKLCVAKSQVSERASERLAALAAHRAAWHALDAIRRLHAAGVEVQALGYDSKVFV